MPKTNRPETPKTLAVALKYARSSMAPRIVAKGGGKTAERILRLAAEHGVEVVRDKALASALFPVELGDYIPERYYEAVARIFAFISLIEGRR